MDRPINSPPATPPATAPVPPPAPQWTAVQLVLFRFAFAWFLLYILFNPNALGIPGIHSFYIRPLHHLVPWIAAHVLHVSNPVTVHPTGSGDTAYDNIGYLLVLVAAAGVCLLWSVADRRRRSYPAALYWLTTIVRYYLGITMLGYGYAKVFKVQMPYPDLLRLVEPYGDSSPFALAWTFMGYSYGYSLFAGLTEVLAGALLLFRRTTVIGALISLIVSANIVAMNYSFDIPVKLLSTTMVLMSLFLLGDNIRRLGALFFRDRPTRLRIVAPPPIRSKGARVTMRVVKFLLIAWFATIPALRYATVEFRYGDNAPRIVLRGIYNVRDFTRNGVTLPPLQTDSFRWKQLIIDGPRNAFAAIKMMNDSVRRYSVTIDSNLHTLAIVNPADSGMDWQLSYAMAAGDSLLLRGKQNRGTSSDSIRVTLIRYPLSRFELNSRGFHWINEYPYNR